MTFSLETDLRLTQAGPAQDALLREPALAGRGREFAASLLMSADTNQPETLPISLLGEASSSALVLSALPMTQAQEPAAEIPLPETDLALELKPETPAPSLPPETPLETLPDQALSETDAAPNQAELQASQIAVPDAAPIEKAPSVEPPLIAQHTEEALPLSQEAEPAELTAPEPQRATEMVVAQAPLAPLPMQAVPKTDDKTVPAVTSDIAAKPTTVTDARPLPQATALVQKDAPKAEPTPSFTDHPANEAAPLMSSAPAIEAEAPGAAQTPQTSALPVGSAPPMPALPQTPVTAPAMAAQLAPTHAALIATTTEIPDIIARSASEGGDDRITVQLDPPELGRVSIDFKFDAAGLQHITVTAETPEAMRQLRAMHFELIQALERNGLSGQDMTFNQQGAQHQDDQGANAQRSFSGNYAASREITDAAPERAALPSRPLTPGDRLDIRL